MVSCNFFSTWLVVAFMFFLYPCCFSLEQVLFEDKSIENSDDSKSTHERQARKFGQQLQKFRDCCKKLDFIRGDPAKLQKINTLLSDTKIDEYVKTDIAWFNARFVPHETFLPAPRGATKYLWNSLQNLGLWTAQSFQLYGNQKALNVMALTPSNAPLMSAIVQQLTHQMNITPPTYVYLVKDDDTCYMVNQSTLLLSKKDLEGCYDDEIEFLVAHEFAHSKTGTCLEDFDFLQKLIWECVKSCSSEAAGLSSQCLEFCQLSADDRQYLMYFLLMAVERMADTIAVKETENPSALIRVHQRLEHTDSLLGPCIFYWLSTHPHSQERAAFGWALYNKPDQESKQRLRASKDKLQALRYSLINLKSQLIRLSERLGQLKRP